MIHYIDSTVALYAASRAQRYKSAAVDVLRSIATGSLDAATSTAVVEDILYRFAGLGRQEEGIDLADQFMRVVPAVYEVSASDLARAFALMRAETRIPFRAAIHGAIMQSHGITTIISVDTAFDLVPDCTRLDLGDWQSSP